MNTTHTPLLRSAAAPQVDAFVDVSSQPLTSKQRKIEKCASHCLAYLKNLALLDAIPEKALQQAVTELTKAGMRDTAYEQRLPDVLPADHGEYGEVRNLFNRLLQVTSMLSDHLSINTLSTREGPMIKPHIVIAGGHRDEMDPPKICVAMDSQGSGLGKSELMTEAKYRYTGITSLLEKMKIVPIERNGSEEKKTQALEQIQQRMFEGMHVGLFPEGTCSPVPGGKMGAFKPGFLRIAREFQFTEKQPAPMMPALLLPAKGDQGAQYVVGDTPVDASVLRDKATELKQLMSVDESKLAKTKLEHIECMLMREVVMQLDPDHAAQRADEKSEYTPERIDSLLELGARNRPLLAKVMKAQRQPQIQAAQTAVATWAGEALPESMHRETLCESINQLLAFRDAHHQAGRGSSNYAAMTQLIAILSLALVVAVLAAQYSGRE